MTGKERFYEGAVNAGKRSAPAALRNREPIANVLQDWLPASGLVLEVASGTGEHIVFFAGRFPHLEWQPSDVHPPALQSIRAWKQETRPANVRDPILLDASSGNWPIEHADAVLSINMVHISPWSAALGLLDGAERLLGRGAPLILYGPWLSDGIEAAPSNLAFDADLRRRDSEWGLRKVEDFTAEARQRGFDFADRRQMPANNMMLLFRKGTI